jgi:hypothetical protein
MVDRRLLLLGLLRRRRNNRGLSIEIEGPVACVLCRLRGEGSVVDGWLARSGWLRMCAQHVCAAIDAQKTKKTRMSHHRSQRQASQDRSTNLDLVSERRGHGRQPLAATDANKGACVRCVEAGGLPWR